MITNLESSKQHGPLFKMSVRFSLILFPGQSQMNLKMSTLQLSSAVLMQRMEIILDC